MRNVLNKAVSGFSAAKAFLVMCLLSIASFAQTTGLEQLGTEITTRLTSLENTIITVGLVLIGIAVVTGAVMYFKGLGRRVG